MSHLSPIYTPRARGSTLLNELKPYRRRIGKSLMILSWSTTTHGLVEWHWPLDFLGYRVPPRELLMYRLTHDFRAPSCLCAAINVDQDGEYCETSIFQRPKANDANTVQWIAACANRRCGYYIILDRYLHRACQPQRKYPPRVGDIHVPPAPPIPANVDPDSTDDEAGPGNSSPMPATQPKPKRVRAAMSTGGKPPKKVDKGKMVKKMPKFEIMPAAGPSGGDVFTESAHASASGGSMAGTPSNSKQVVDIPTLSAFQQLLLLDDFDTPGLTEKQFKALFLRCQTCYRYKTVSGMELHECQVIDLTED